MLFSRPTSLSVCIALFVTLITLVQSSPAPHRGGPAKGLGVPISNTDATDIIANRYIVVYNNNATDEDVEKHQAMIASSLRKRNLNARSLDGRALSSETTPFSMQGWRGTILDADDSMMLEIADMSDVRFLSFFGGLSLG